MPNWSVEYACPGWNVLFRGRRVLTTETEAAANWIVGAFNRLGTIPPKELR